MSTDSWRGFLRAISLALAPVVALGFTRFAYALLLPGMQETLQWNLAEAGALNTANGAGFVLGALSASRLAGRYGTVRVFGLSMAAGALALMATAWLDSWSGFLVVRALGGAATACAFVIGSALAPLALPRRPGLAVAIYFGGTGVGMVLAGSGWGSGVFSHMAGWRLGWMTMGAAAWLATAVSVAAAWRLHCPGGEHSGASAPSHSLHAAIAPTLMANALYGAGYVGYTTFVIALLEQRGLGPSTSALVFCLIGGASILASPAWGQWLERQRGGRGFAMVNILLGLGLVPVLVSDHLLAVLGSAVAFGAVFMAGPTAVAVVAQRELRTADLARGLGLLTAAFSVGQSFGPLLSGALADGGGTLEFGLWAGPLLLLAGSSVSLAQKSASARVPQ